MATDHDSPIAATTHGPGVGCTCEWDEVGNPVGGKHKPPCRMAEGSDAASDAYIGVSEETYAQLVKIAQSLDCTINAAAEEVLREFFERKEMEPWA